MSISPREKGKSTQDPNTLSVGAKSSKPKTTPKQAQSMADRVTATPKKKEKPKFFQKFRF